MSTHRGTGGFEALRKRHNIHVCGEGPVTLLLVHGYGCSQAMWRHVVPDLEWQARIVLVDLVGFGSSDYAAYDLRKYATLNGHAEDLLEISGKFGKPPTVHVGHSVGAMMGVLADLMSPSSFAAHVMVAPTPCLHNDGDYRGGHERNDLQAMLTFLDVHFPEWARDMAALIAGTDPHGPLASELLQSFCRAEPAAARQLARATFNMDLRPELRRLAKPTFILQSTDDGLAYVGVGEYVQSQIPGSELQLVNTSGHCPHITAPQVCSDAILNFVNRVASTWQAVGDSPAPRRSALP